METETYAMNLSALETSVVPSTVVKNDAQGNRNVKVDAKDIGFEGSAKASSGFKISQTLDEIAAWEGWW